MRIFGGTAKGRIITVPKGAELRPSTDRTRLALFNAISALIPGSRFLDLCCGTGAVGLEAMSRGAAHVAFCDSQRPCIDAVRESIKNFGLDAQGYELLPMDLRKAIQRLSTGKPYDLVFLDPPYDAALGKESLQVLVASGLLTRSPDTRVILEHAGSDDSPVVQGLELYRRYDHGAASLSVYGLEASAHAL